MKYNSNQIGYYIHYNYDNYTKYGLLPSFSKTREFNYSPASVLGQLLKEEKQKVIGDFYLSNKDVLIKKIEKNMNYFLGAGSLDAGSNINYAEAIVKHLGDKFGVNFSPSDIDWKNLTLSPTGVKKIEAKKWNPKDFDLSISTLKHSTAGKTSERGLTNIKSIQNQITDIAKACGQLTVAKKGKYQISALTKRLEVLDTKLKNLKGRVNIYAQTELNLSAQEFLNKTETRAGKEVTFIDEVRKIAQVIFSGSIQSMVEGELLEACIANWNILFKETFIEGMEEIGEALGEVLGSTEGTVRYDSKNFIKDLDLDKMLGSNYKKTANNGVIAYDFNKSVKGKADARLTLKNGSSLIFNAKNYNLDSENSTITDISLVRETNLLYLFQNRARFLNHYLNQTVETAPKNTVKAANHVMRQMLTLVGMSGGGIRSDSTSKLRSNVMVINNKASKVNPIRVVPVDWLYTQLIKYYNKLNISLNVDQTWPNTYIGDKQNNNFVEGIQRISSLLMAVKAHHISVQIPKSTIKQILSYI